MALRLVHLLDESTPEDSLRQVSLLLERLPQADVDQRLVIIGGRSRRLAGLEQVAAARVARPGPWPFLWALDLRRELARRAADVIHAWSPDAAAAAVLAGAQAGRLLATLSDPAQGREAARWRWSFRDGRYRFLRGATRGVFFVCASKMIQRRAVEAGIQLVETAVIRPGVDFGAIRRAKERDVRSQLRLNGAGRVFLTPSPPSRAGGHFLAAWAMAILHQIWPDGRLLVPGSSREAERLLRLRRQLYCPAMVVPVGDEWSPAELLSASDMLLVPATGDVPTGWLSEAMAAGVPILGAAVPAVAELIADRHNGCLFKPGEPHSLAGRIRAAWKAPAELRRFAEVARGQAYDVFRAESNLQQYRRLYDNAAAGRPSGEGVRDTAMDA